MDKFIPSYENYRKILKNIKNSGKYKDFIEAKSAEQFLILRHDIEFSVERAYRMAMIEQEEGIASTYFLQITSNAYNAFSENNLFLLKEMISAGHFIGLHYHLSENLEMLHIRDDIRDQIRIMSEFLKYQVDRFSIHRPVEESKYYDINIEGIINAYSKEFFSHVVDVMPEVRLDIKYIADSKHRWNYGCPDKKTIAMHPKIQLLIHPYSWSNTGEGMFELFNGLRDEKEREMLDTFNRETKIYQLVKDQIELRRGL